MNKIIPKIYKQGDSIPLQLECTVNDTIIYYDKLPIDNNGYQGYRFYTNTDIPEEEAEEKVKILIDQILDEHDESEHGVSWRTKSFEHIENWYYHTFDWRYRVRDSY